MVICTNLSLVLEIWLKNRWKFADFQIISPFYLNKVCRNLRLIGAKLLNFKILSLVFGAFSPKALGLGVGGSGALGVE